MSGWHDSEGEMRNLLLLDHDTADRLLTGRMQPEDAPPGYANVAELLSAASSMPSIDAERELSTVAAMSEEIRSQHALDAPRRKGTALSRFTRAKIVAVVVGATLLGTTGLAFAGGLPDPAQNVAHSVLARIGITVPAGHTNADSDVGSGGGSSSAATGSQPTNTTGPQISHLAGTTTAMGVAKGAVISAVASHGPSQAGEQPGQSGIAHGQSGVEHGQAGEQPGQSGVQHDQSGTTPGQSVGHSHSR